MEIITCTDYEALSSRSAEILRHEIEKKPNLLLCPARGLFSGKVTTALPASFLWLHPGVVCLVDQQSI